MKKEPKVKKAIERLETQIGRRLPEDYRKYLLESNGGVPALPTFTIPKIDQEALVDVFYGAGVEQRESDIFQWLEELEGKIPASWLPIGCDPGGNIILLDLSKPTKSTVLYWDATRSFRQSTDKTNTYRLADSFSAFLKKLYAEPKV